MRRALWLVVLSLSCVGSARAWDSYCDDNGKECAPGPDAAHLPWVGREAGSKRSDEHSRLFARALDQAGVSMSTRSLALEIYTSRPKWIAPAPFGKVTVRSQHSRAVNEFAQLPDFGYSLADWASQFETCPSDPGADAVSCHALTHHMAAINSNHFVPQSSNFYRYYHELALTKASECAFMGSAIGERREEFLSFLQECDGEALTLEAIGQHYLEDAWSTGHMWERWGSPEYSELPRTGERSSSAVLNGLIVGAVAGGIHGSEAMSTVPDAMCSPDENVHFVSDAASHPGLGDLYADQLLADPAYGLQRERLLACSTAGISEVYAASSHTMDPNFAAGAVMPGGCFDQRATNEAMYEGLGYLGTASTFIGIGQIVKWFGLPEASSQDVALAQAKLNVDLELVVTQIARWKEDAPDGTQTASGALLPLLDMKANSRYAAATAATPASYVDLPVTEWTVNPEGPNTPAETLTYVFHRGHAWQWCPVMTEARLEDLRMQARAAGAGSAKHALCVEHARRHARRRFPKNAPTLSVCPTPSTAPATDQGPGRPSLCELLTGGTAFVIDVDAQRADTPALVLAETWCAQTDDEAKSEAMRHTCDTKTPSFTGTAGLANEMRAGRVAHGQQMPSTGSNGNQTQLPGGLHDTGNGSAGTPNNNGMPGSQQPVTGNTELAPPPPPPCPFGQRIANAPPLSGYTCDESQLTDSPPPQSALPEPHSQEDWVRKIVDLIKAGKRFLGMDGGDPHFRTVDGLRYDFQATGDFVVARSSDGSLEIQGRQSPFPGSCSDMAWNSAFAFKVAGAHVELYQSHPGVALIDGVMRSINPGETAQLVGGGRISRHGGAPLWIIVWPDGTVARVSERAGSVHAQFEPAPVLIGALQGLLGNFNGDPRDDLRDANGAVIPVSAIREHTSQFEVSEQRMQNDFAAAWRVPTARSLFSLSDGFAPPTASLPQHDLSLDRVREARAACIRAGVIDPTWQQACVVDVSCSDATAALALGDVLAPELVARSDVESDRDCLTTEQEIQYGTDKTRADTDGDGVFDGLEVAARTDPTIARDHPQARGDRVAQVTAGRTVDVQFAIPTSIEQADVYVLIDVTGSMSSSISNVRSNLTGSGGVIESVRAAMPNAQFGVGSFSDYAYPLPAYQHVQDITPDVDAVQAAVDRLVTGNANSDAPEALFPALWSMSTGAGLTGASAWANGRAMSVTFTPCPIGRWGWPCFRANAVPVVVAITDATQHNGPSDQLPYDFAAPKYADALEALKARGVKVVGVAVNSAAAPDLTAVARGTGAVDAAGAALVSTSAGAVSTRVTEQVVSLSRAPHDLGVLLRDDLADDLDLSSWIRQVSPVPEGNSSLNCRAHAALIDRDGDGINESFAGVQAGAPVCFRTTLQIPVMPATDRPTAFVLRAAVQADGSESAVRRLWLVVPPTTEQLTPTFRDSVTALIPALP